MPRIWQIMDEFGATITFKASKSEADQIAKDEGGFVSPLRYEDTREGIAKLLDVFGGGAGGHFVAKRLADGENLATVYAKLAGARPTPTRSYPD